MAVNRLPFSGWRFWDEDQSILQSQESIEFGAVARDNIRKYGVGTLFTVADPTKLFTDPEGTLQTENQQQTNSCVGHGGSSTMEWVLWLTKGAKEQLSRMCAYIESQKTAGIRGDNGSTISAMSRIAKSGICREKTWPFTGRYSTSAPSGWQEEAKQFQVLKTTGMQSVSDYQEFLGNGLGGLCCGFMWNDYFDRDADVIETWKAANGGGHCVCIPFLAPDKDNNGDHYGWLLNSWGLNWGRRGWKKIAPKAMDALLRHQWTEVHGFSDMDNPMPRKITHVTL